MEYFCREISNIENAENNETSVNFNHVYQNCLHALSLPSGSLCFFDIETTGLSPSVSSVYLIGAMVLQDNKLILHQWFADDYISEKDLLLSFSSFTATKKYLVHYNGSSFDVPYLKKKYEAHHLTSPFDGKNQIDLFKVTKLKMFQNGFPLKNRKLKTMETLMGFYRHDNYSGKDCIALYTDFMQKKFFRDNKMASLRKKLLLHNEEDLIGTFLCSQLLLYQKPELISADYFIEEHQLHFTGIIHGYYPRSLTYENGGYHILLKDSSLHLQIPLFSGTLYHFFPDYKNYFYLPEEDMAIHKSVGIFVEPAFRQKATAANCYIKREEEFFPLPLTFHVSTLSDSSNLLFTKSRRDKAFYLPISECEKLFAKNNLCDFIRNYTYAVITAPSPA